MNMFIQILVSFAIFCSFVFFGFIVGEQYARGSTEKKVNHYHIHMDDPQGFNAMFQANSLVEQNASN